MNLHCDLKNGGEQNRTPQEKEREEEKKKERKVKERELGLYTNQFRRKIFMAGKSEGGGERGNGGRTNDIPRHSLVGRPGFRGSRVKK